LVPEVQKTVQEMIDNSNNADEDYFDRKEELNEQEQELNEIQEVLVVFRKNYKKKRRKLSISFRKSKNN